MADEITPGELREVYLGTVRDMAKGMVESVYNIGQAVGNGPLSYVTMADIASEVAAGLGGDVPDGLFGMLCDAYDRGLKSIQ